MNIFENPEYKVLKEYYQRIGIDERTASNVAWEDCFAVEYTNGRLRNGQDVSDSAREIIKNVKHAAEVEIKKKEAMLLQNRKESFRIEPWDAYP